MKVKNHTNSRLISEKKKWKTAAPKKTENKLKVAATGLKNFFLCLTKRVRIKG